jgi:hypothetical protein
MTRDERRETRSRQPAAGSRRLCRHAMLALATAACGLSPIDHRIKLGEEPFVVFVGEGIDGSTDLFTTTTGGGSVFQLTFTTVIERQPKLSADGMMVAFLRIRDTLPGTRRDVVVMNLQNGTERIVPLPASAGLPAELGWGSGDSTLYIHTAAGVWQTSIPPAGTEAIPVAGADTLFARKAVGAWLGSPAFAEAIPCASGLCIIGPRHDTTSLSPTGHDPMRWGKDSVAWIEGSEFVVRPLGAGRARRVSLQSPPKRVREGSVGGER